MRWFNLSGGGSQTETRQYNSLGQMTRLTIPGQIDREYRFSATANDGKATSQKDYVTGEELEYQYDSLGRLANAETTGAGGWGMSFVYDGWGNRLQQNVVKGSVPTQSILVDPATNRIQSHSYDSNGNTTNPPAQGAMTFDVMDRLKTVASDTYGYTPANQRQWKNSDFTLWGADGVRVVTAQVATIGSDLRFTQLAFDSYSHGRRLQVTDRLGSVGNYFPYGEAKSGTVSNADSFATYYRDSSGLDYAQQRYYQPASGRFLTTDPKQSSADSKSPETWNRYGYSANDPANLHDPTGLITVTTTPVCVMIAGPSYFCTTILATDTGKAYIGTAVSAGYQDALRLSIDQANVAGGWELTNALLSDAAAALAKDGGITQSCWDEVLSKIQGGVTTDLKRLRGIASRSNLFSDGTKVVGNTTLQMNVIQQFKKPNVYAVAEIDFPHIWWRPGVNGQGRVSNWLLGAVLHEILHNAGFYDDEIQSSLNIEVNQEYTDNITQLLAERCF